MRRKSNEVTLKAAIEALMEHYHLGDRYRFEQIKQRWEEIVGKMIADVYKRQSSRCQLLLLKFE